MNEILFWLGLCAIFAIVEGITIGLTSIWFAVGALATALLTCIFDIGTGFQILTFAIVSTGLIVATRPIAKRKFNNRIPKTNLDAIIGNSGKVTKPIDSENGEVYLDGKEWTAISDQKISEGEHVVVKEIRGVTLIVERKNQ